MDIMSKFLRSEINTQDLYEEIFNFIVSCHIRNGELEGNEYIIKKIDKNNFIIFPEYSDSNDIRYIPFAMSVYKEQLIKEINNMAEKKGLLILK